MQEKTSIVLGSANKAGNTAALVAQVLAIESKQPVKVYDLQDYQISPFDYEHRNIDDDFIGLVEQLLKFDTIVFASPVYWYSMSAQMKVFFDRLSDLLHIKKSLGRQLRSKSTAVLSTGATEKPERSFEEVFTNSFDYLGMNYVGMIYCYCEQEFVVKKHKKYIKGQWQNMLKKLA